MGSSLLVGRKRFHKCHGIREKDLDSFIFLHIYKLFINHSIYIIITFKMI